jgi:hypothetical protein
LPFQSKVGNEQLPEIERFARIVKKSAVARISAESADAAIVGGPPGIHLD